MPNLLESDLLPLDEAVCSLRRQITEAMDAAANESLRFKLNSIELEFSVVAKREEGLDGKVKFSVLGIGAELGGVEKVAGERTQKVKISLAPVVIDGSGNETPILVSDSGRRPVTQD